MSWEIVFPLCPSRGEQARLARADRESALPIGPLRGDVSPLNMFLNPDLPFITPQAMTSKPPQFSSVDTRNPSAPL